MIAVLGLSGFLSAISGIIITSRLGAGSGTYRAESLLLAVAGVMIGGVSLFGGVGNLIGTLGGVLIIVSINNGLVLLNILPVLAAGGRRHRHPLRRAHRPVGQGAASRRSATRPIGNGLWDGTVPTPTEL